VQETAPPEWSSTQRRSYTELERECAELRTALQSRIIIEQAKGMLSERLSIPPDEAFEVLRRHARSNGLRLHAVCDEVVSGTLSIEHHIVQK
jgi:AmiR/NasT family two-component response regulator